MGIHFVVAGIMNLAMCAARPFHVDNSHWVARIYSGMALRILGMDLKLETQSLDAMGQPCVIVCNHQSNYDLFVVGAAVPRRTVTVGKKSLAWVPFFGQIFWLAGNVLIVREDASKAKSAMLRTSRKLREQGANIWIFPEGTRSKGRGLLPFKKGAFKMAIDAGVPMIPVCASSYINRMDLSRPKSCEAIIKSLAPIPTEGMTEADIPALMKLCRDRMEACIHELDARVADRS